MPEPTPAALRRALAANAVGTAVNEAGEWLPLTARQAVADAVLAAVEPVAEHCIHDPGMHHRHHRIPVIGCPWCVDAGTRVDPFGYEERERTGRNAGLHLDPDPQPVAPEFFEQLHRTTARGEVGPTPAGTVDNPDRLREQYRAEILAVDLDDADAIADAVLAVRDTELQQLREQLRLVHGYADAWFRSGTGPTRECGRTILAAIRQQGECRRCHCPASAPQCDHCNCCDVPDPQEQP